MNGELIESLSIPSNSSRRSIEGIAQSATPFSKDVPFAGY